MIGSPVPPVSVTQSFTFGRSMKAPSSARASDIVVIPPAAIRNMPAKKAFDDFVAGHDIVGLVHIRPHHIEESFRDGFRPWYFQHDFSCIFHLGNQEHNGEGL